MSEEFPDPDLRPERTPRQDSSRRRYALVGLLAAALAAALVGGALLNPARTTTAPEAEGIGLAAVAGASIAAVGNAGSDRIGGGNGTGGAATNPGAGATGSPTVPASSPAVPASVPASATGSISPSARSSTAATPRRTTPAPPPPVSASERMENEVTTLVNQERAKIGCGAVHTDERLRTASRGHSTDMAVNDYFNHTGLDGSSPWDRSRAAGYNQAIGENIAFGYRTAADVMNGWMNSAGHKANILNCAARAIGVGVAFKADGTPYWTQLFGSV